MKYIIAGCFATIALWLVGCAELGYYHQAAMGQWQLLSLRRPIEAVQADPATPAELRERLALVAAMRYFAHQELQLPDNGSYQSYADLGRDYVVRNVFAAPPLSLELQKWCFPIAGCVGYRGYFDAADADAFAQELRTQGLDVYLGNVPAFSTLGWFHDPLLNTFIHWQPGLLADLLFHELAHQRLYVAGDTTFNESFATFVGRLGARRFLQSQGDASMLEEYQQVLAFREAFEALVLPTRTALEELYAADVSDAEKQQQKQQLLAALVDRYETLRDSQWQGYRGFDRWFYEDLNNAKLGARRAYTRWVPAFEALYAQANGDIAAFYQRVDALAELPEAAREARLTDLMETS